MRGELIAGTVIQDNGTTNPFPDVSVVVPVRDEVESLPLLLEAIAHTLNQINLIV